MLNKKLMTSIGNLLHGAETFLRSWPVLCQSRNTPHLFEPEGSLEHSQVPATCPYPKPALSSLYPTFFFLKINFNITLPFKPGLPSGLYPSRFPTRNLYTPLPSPIHATYSGHLIPSGLVTRTMLVEGNKSLCPSLCSFLHSLVFSPSYAKKLSTTPYSQTPSA